MSPSFLSISPRCFRISWAFFSVIAFRRLVVMVLARFRVSFSFCRSVRYSVVNGGSRLNSSSSFMVFDRVWLSRM